MTTSALSVGAAMSANVCPSTGKQMLTHKESIRQALWWRRARFARMSHYRCKKCKAWHIGNRR